MHIHGVSIGLKCNIMVCLFGDILVQHLLRYQCTYFTMYFSY